MPKCSESPQRRSSFPFSTPVRVGNQVHPGTPVAPVKKRHLPPLPSRAWQYVLPSQLNQGIPKPTPTRSYLDHSQQDPFAIAIKNESGIPATEEPGDHPQVEGRRHTPPEPSFMSRLRDVSPNAGFEIGNPSRPSPLIPSPQLCPGAVKDEELAGSLKGNRHVPKTRVVSEKQGTHLLLITIQKVTLYRSLLSAQEGRPPASPGCKECQREVSTGGWHLSSSEVSRRSDRPQPQSGTLQELSALDLQKKRELVKDIRVEAEATSTELFEALERLEQMETVLQALEENVERYKGWWLTEHYSLRGLLAALPAHERRNWDVIASHSYSRFSQYSIIS